MIISDDSPLRKLPALPRKQMLSFDGIRYSVDMAEIAYSRVAQSLLTQTVTLNEGKKVGQSAFVSTFQDAWSVVDSLHRLIGLLKQTRGLKQNIPALQLFYRKMSIVEVLRNGVQHLNTEIDNLVALNLPVWGCLGWVAQLDPEKPEWYSGILMPGAVFGGAEEYFVNFRGKPFAAPIDLITLTAFGHSLDLSDAMRQVVKVTRALEGGIEQAIKEMPDAPGHPGSDLSVVMKIEGSRQPGNEEGTQ